MNRPENFHVPAVSPAAAGAVANAQSGAAFFVALLVFLSAAYFQNSRPGWNVNSQFALTCAIVERGVLSIDAYHDQPQFETNDKAFFEGHFYSDKSPVTAFLGIPAFWTYRQLVRSAGADLDYARARYWTTWWTIGLSAAILTMLTTLLLRRSGLPETWAAMLAGLWVMATPLFGYSILFYNYAPAAAMALGGFLIVQPALERRKGNPATCAWPTPAAFLAGGIFLGLASWTLQTNALLAFALSAGLAWSAFRSPDVPISSRLTGAGSWTLGGLIGAGGYALYSLAIFGEVTSPYRYEFDATFREMMSRGLMGAGLPDLKVLQLISVHPYHGLFFLFPMTVVAVLGCLSLLGSPRLRGSAAVALAFLGALLLYNAGYYMWWGGSAYAPRHLIPALAPLSLGLGGWVRPADGSLRRATLALVVVIGLAGAVFNVAAVSLDPQPGHQLFQEELMSPGTVETWPSARMLDLVRYVAAGQTDANWGTGLGLKGPASLFPLALMWVAALLALAFLRDVSWWMVAGLTATFALAAGLRLPYLDLAPPGMWFDEALNGQDALAAAVTGRFRLVYTDVFPREPLFITIMALVIKAGVTTLAGLRMLPVAIGLVTVISLYAALRIAGERGLALAAAASLGALRWHALMSRLLFRTLLLPLWITMLVGAAFALRKKATWPRLVCFGVLLGGGFYTYLAWYFMLPGVGLLAVWALWPLLREPGRRMRALGCLGVAALTVAPLAVDYARHPDHIASRPQAVALGGGGDGVGGAFAEIAKNAKDAAGMFHVRGDHVPLVNVPEAPALDPIVGALFVIGFVAALYGAAKRRPLEIIVLGWLFLGIAPTIFTKTDSPNFLRTLVATPAVAILIGMGLIRPGTWLAGRYSGPAPRFVFVALCALLLLASGTMSARDIIFHWARDERVWQASNAFEAQIGQAVAAAPPEVSVWIPASIRDHRTVRFLTSYRDAIHSYRDFAFLRPADGVGGGRWIVVTFHNQLFPVLHELVPEGRIVTVFPWPGGGATGLIYEIPQGALPPAGMVNRAEARHPVDDISF